MAGGMIDSASTVSRVDLAGIHRSPRWPLDQLYEPGGDALGHPQPVDWKSTSRSA